MEPSSRRAEDLGQETRTALERTARVFGDLAATARRAGDHARAARLQALADQAAQRAMHLEAGATPAARAAAAVPPPMKPRPTGPVRDVGAVRRVLLVDDHELAREALRSVLSTAPDLAVVGEAATGDAAVRLARQLEPDVVLMDIRLPGLDGLAATRSLLAEQPGTRVIMLTSLEQRPTVLEALRAGAAAYLLKGASKQEVLDTVRAVLAGERRVQSSLAADLLAGDAATGDTGPVPALSEREIEVLRLLARDASTAEISQTLVVSPNTVKTHVRHLLRKLDAPDRARAVARAAALGLLPGPDTPQPS